MNNNALVSFRGPMGVPVQIDPSFLMLFGMLIYLNGTEDIAWSLAFFAMLAGSIFLHELGHAWGYLIQGLPVQRIVLHGGGGFCQGLRSGTPREEELIVAMGPVVNLLLWSITGLASQFLVPDDWTRTIVYMGYFSRLNFVLAVFNLIPVFPLDGGRLLHLVLLRWLPYPTACRVSGAFGIVLAVLWIPAAVLFFLGFGWILFFFPSIVAHYRMFRDRRG